MSGELLRELMDRSQALSTDEKRFLAEYLENDLRGKSNAVLPRRNGSPADAAKHLAWLKAHREEYSGMYVALDGDKLVGKGANRREAVEEAKQNGIDDPFAVYVLSESVIADGGL